ncbi:DUF748 domain-containing protein [Vibrio gangliei]|uniref:DUF748 domain-containing protein n=1 Tax=Vibrio gangliei TaxID=2077090 RepID=UPI000D0187E7|nr:DUF748 domain-containing protein [Vibrio gangliei]
MPSALKQAYTRFKQAPLSLRIFSYLLVAYGVYAIVLGLIIPSVLQSQAPKQLSTLLGRDVQIQQVRINPFLLRVRISGFEIKEQSNDDAFVKFEKLDVQLGFWKSVFSLAPTVEHFYLVKPQVTIARVNSDSEFNFSDIIDTLAANASQEESAPEPEKQKSALPAFHAQDIQLSQGQFDYLDQPTGAHLQYKGLDINLPQLDSQALTVIKPQQTADGKTTTAGNQINHFELNVTGADEGSLALKGQFQFEPFALQGDVSLNKITLARFWPFAEKELKAKLTNGQFDLATRFELKQDDQAFNFSTQKGHFALRNLEFSDEQTPKIKLPSLTVNNVALDSQKRDIDIKSVTLDGLWIDSVLTKSGLDLQTLFSPKSQSTVSENATSKNTTPENAQADEAPKPVVSVDETHVSKPDNASSSDADWIVHLHQFAMQNTDIHLKEQMVSHGVNWRVYPLNISTQDIYSDLRNPIAYSLDVSVNSWLKAEPEHTRGSLTSVGQIDAKALTAQGNIALKDLDLTQLQTYLDPYLNVQLRSGKLSTDGQFTADTNGQATYNGSAQVAALNIRDKVEYQPLVKWSNMAINNLSFDQAKNTLKINTITFTAPYGKVLIDKNRQTNIGNLVKPQPASVSTAKSNSSPSKPMSVYVGQIRINSGSAYFADYSLPTSFQSGIESISGNIRNISSTPGTKATVNINGKINKYAPVTLKGAINPLIERPYLDLDLVFKSVELTSVNPYSGTYAGYYIDKGQLSLDLKYQLENNQLVGDNHLVIDQLKLGEPSDSDLATGLPLKLAIALLQDRNGVIDLGMQVSGDVNDPDFSVGGIVLKALTNVITKVVTSPFSMLASLAGSDEELNHVTYAAGKADLSDEAKEQLTTLAKALLDRPQLTISITGAVDAATDSQALAEAKVQSLLLEDSGVDALPADASASTIAKNEGLADSVEDLYEDLLKKDVGDEEDKIEQQLKQNNADGKVNSEELETALHISLYNQLVEAQNISQDDLGILAEERARNIKAYLVDEQRLSPERVFILDSKSKLITDSQGAELTIDAK